MSIDWNKKHPPYLVLGLTNGVVCSFDIRNQVSTMSQAKIEFNKQKGEVKGKHTDVVWSALWEEETISTISEEDDALMYQRRQLEKEVEADTRDEMKKKGSYKADSEQKKEEIQILSNTESERHGEGRGIGVGLVLSVGGDGRVVRWRREKDRMIPRDIMTIQSESVESQAKAAEQLEEEKEKVGKSLIQDVTGSPSQQYSVAAMDGSDEQAIIFQQAVSGCTCLDIHPTRTHLILVGTEEGNIYKCTKAYSGEILSQYTISNKKNPMPIYTVCWNKIHPRVFLTSGADWNVYLWDHTQQEPQLSFPLGSSVGDVCWSPYSATVFAACTSEGKVFVYDLSINRQEQLCEQLIVRSSKLTRISFSLFDPILAVADEKGNVHTFKLSPNLRRAFKNSTVEQEIEKMESVLDYATRCKEAGI
ncbi:MAG: putative Dynein intermediate chain 2, ciliary [Streblomastix strix]|uniref:Putative Dynein intermediate chain 2, ciliary n=1 Tax=Streblomastix strix TaxID=222440 RepID=A0A5J4VFZ1_9EUKA|nr:MAG: putative Dynein intermediate chain 2, ciliary [Streblomastix strix]